ncbi:MAG TPA: WYL domain-containing protein [Fimbriimonadaceae bacterium]|nr:WYL domain-containing protein [Fimbriimonadaceae bacterium]
MTKTERLTAEILLLQERPRTSLEMAELLEISKRTVLRDVQALCEMGVPVIAREGYEGGYSLPQDYTLRPLALSWKEAALLTLALGTISKLDDAPFAAERQSLLAKIDAVMPERHRDQVAKVLEKVGIEVHGGGRKAPWLDPILAWIEEGAWMQMAYKTYGGEFTATIKPLRIDSDRGRWRLWARNAGLERFYFVERILKAEKVAAPTEEPKDIPYDDPSHPAIRIGLTQVGIARLEIDKHFGPHVRGLEAPASIEFRCPRGEFDWYARFFGGMAPDVVVESPEELRDMIRVRAAGVLSIYENS